MGHQLDHCDIIDMLEEAVTLDRAVAIELRNNAHFVDRVRDVVTRDGADWAIFASHEPVLVKDIHSCARAEPWEPGQAPERH